MTAIDTAPMRLAAEAGLQLIPLHRWDACSADKSGTPRQDGKRPADSDWTRKTYVNEKVIERAERGGLNVGVRLTEQQLVIDVDPRNFPKGRNVLAELSAAIGVDLSAWTPRTETGSGGLHLWMSKPADLAVVDGLPEFPGVEFKTRGRQVVAPGSIHPNGRPYVLVDELEDLREPEAAPARLLDLARRPIRRYEAGDPDGDAQLSNDEVASILTAMGDVPDYHDWVKVLMACHAVSGGMALAECQEWSHDGDTELVADKWRGFDAGGNGSGRAGWGTLAFIARKYGGDQAMVEALCADIWRGDPADDFADSADIDMPDAIRDAPKPTELLSDGTPMTVAAAMLKGRAVIRSNGDWLKFDASLNCYRDVADETFEAGVWRWVQGRAYRAPEGVKQLVATRDSVANVLKAAIAQRQGPRDLPAWQPRGADPRPSDLLAVRNGLLHLPTMELLAPTPRFVNRNASPVEYDELAAEPARWLRFLDEVFGGDREMADTLQEVMGYLLTQDTSQQKVFCLVGPPRSGKGTINRVIQMLVGEGNYTSPTANNLARGDFGLQRLIGRQLATISDMRMGRSADPAALAENLLRISGEDEVSIDRKYKEAWEGRLPTRFLLSSNETPQFRDTSGAIVSRMVLMRTVRSFLGTEDTGLGAALKPELPGVLNWSLAGLRRLRQRGHFLQPSASRSELDAMMTLASPVKAFAAERLRADPHAVTAKDVVWLAFKQWAGEEGLPYSGDKGHFFKDLGTCGVAFTPTRIRDEGDRVQAIQGLALLPGQ